MKYARELLMFLFTGTYRRSFIMWIIRVDYNAPDVLKKKKADRNMGELKELE